MKKFLSVALAAGALVVAACGGSGATTAPASTGTESAAPAESSAPGASASNAAGSGLVGIAMPTKSSARWIADGDNMVKVFKEKGYKTDLQYAEDDIPNQLAQIENMITKGVKVLVIASIDGTTLSKALQNAADKGVKVIAYD
ncbi:MAG TPA: substrate-binding domain-containing protein, partial [Candidatus Limnocylindrales bacterium]|nr:substrate-binding domain-containing protein [Candidatus Limnocylindrales bacterium]